MKKIDFHWKSCKKLENEIYAKKVDRIKDINEILKIATMKIKDLIITIC